MSENFWNHPLPLRPVDAGPGKNVMADYAGLHRPQMSSVGEVEQFPEASAQQRYEESRRHLLNEGEDFEGFLAWRQVETFPLCIGRHPQHGLCAFVNLPASNSDGRIEVLVNRTRDKLRLTRADFFGRLLAEPVPAEQLDELCADYRRFHIAMER